MPRILNGSRCCAPIWTALATGVLICLQAACFEPARPEPIRRTPAATQTAAGAADADRKVSQLQQVFDQNRSSDNQIRLAEAQAQAADAHVAVARQSRADRRPRDARRELATALGHMPAHPQAVTMAREVDRDIAQVDSLVQQAVAARDRKDDVTALKLADQALALDRTAATAQQIVSQTRGATLDGFLLEASQALDKRQWDAAASAAAKALQIDPANTQARDIEKKAADRKNAMTLAETGRAAAAKGDDAAAIKAWDQAIPLWPDNAELKAEGNRVRQAAVDRRLAKGDAECAAGRFPAGMAEYDAAAAIAPGDPKVTERYLQAVAQRVKSLQQAFEKHAQAGDWELAWPIAVHLATLRSADETGSRHNLTRSEEMIRRRIASRLRVVPLPSKSARPANVLVVARAMTDELKRIKPDHYELLPLDTTADAISGAPITLADIGDPSKLKAIDPDIAERDLICFVDVTSREYTMDSATTRQQPAAIAQAQLDLQQAREELGRARQLALADERKWDPEARHALNANETFLPKAATGAYGLLAQKAAEDYNAALRKLQQIPADQRNNRPADSGPRPALQMNVRLRLVQATTGRLFWTDDEPEARVSEVGSGTAMPPAATGGDELQSAAVRQVAPMLQTKARELLTRRSLVYLEEGQKGKGDDITRCFVRFLFDLSSDPGPYVVIPAMDEIFSKLAVGAEMEACRKLAAERLKLRLGPAATLPAPTVATPPPPTVAAAPQASDRQPPARVQAPPAPQPQPDRAPAQAVPEPPPAPSVVTPTGVVVYDGYISNGSKQHPREQTLIDGIKVMVKDTDAKPLDTDLQITVGKYVGKFKGLRTGARLRIRGLSGQEYRLTVLHINDDTETVHFTLERPSVQPR